MGACCPAVRRRRVASSPSMSGICTSIKMRSYGLAAAMCQAARPFSAVSAVKPSLRKIARTTCWLVALSSASKMRASRRANGGRTIRPLPPFAATRPRRRSVVQLTSELRFGAVPHAALVCSGRRRSQVPGRFYGYCGDLDEVRRATAVVRQPFIRFNDPPQTFPVHAGHLHINQGQLEGVVGRLGLMQGG
jgi:hypothetical protein